MKSCQTISQKGTCYCWTLSLAQVHDSFFFSSFLSSVVTVFILINHKKISFLGNSAVQAISLLIQKGVPESNIIFLNLISVSYRCLKSSMSIFDFPSAIDFLLLLSSFLCSFDWLHYDFLIFSGS
jgi:hypothetical protein